MVAVKEICQPLIACETYFTVQDNKQDIQNEIKKGKDEVKVIQQSIEKIEDDVYHEFCRRNGLQNIRSVCVIRC